MKEFKGTKGPWECVDMDDDSISEISATMVVCGDVVLAVVGPTAESSLPEDEHNAKLISAAPDLLEALQWALPLARMAMASCQQERVKFGHTDITGTYKNGVTWAGIYQDEIDSIEKSEAAIAKALGE